MFRCLQCGVPVFQALKYLKDFKALHNIYEGMKKKKKKQPKTTLICFVLVFVNGL